MNKLTIDEKESISQARREVFRTLRSNIEFTGVDNRAIVVTSCVPGDGKVPFLLILQEPSQSLEKRRS